LGEVPFASAKHCTRVSKFSAYNGPPRGVRAAKSVCNPSDYLFIEGGKTISRPWLCIKEKDSIRNFQVSSAANIEQQLIMEEPFLMSDEHDGSVGSTCELSENHLIQDVPSNETFERENHRLQLEVKELRIQLAQSTAQLLEEDDKNPTNSLSGVSQTPCYCSLC